MSLSSSDGRCLPYISILTSSAESLVVIQGDDDVEMHDRDGHRTQSAAQARARIFPSYDYDPWALGNSRNESMGPPARPSERLRQAS